MVHVVPQGDMNEQLCGYKAFWRGKTTEVYASSSYRAQCLAAEHWRVRPNKRHEITVVICERADGSQVVHSPLF